MFLNREAAKVAKILLQLRLDLLSRIFISPQVSRALLHQRGGGFVGEVAAEQIFQGLR
jgi:hypothetical protein